jgi:flagellar biosynthesis protein
MKDRYYDFRKKTAPRAAAAALQYDPVSSEPPMVVAAGHGLVAEQIIAIAKAHDVPLREDPGLVEALSRLEVGSVLPRELYVVVAEVLAWVYRVDMGAEEQRVDVTVRKR